MHYLALQMTECLIKNKVAEATEKDDCINGIEMFLNKFLVYGTILIIAAIEHQFASGVIFIIFLIGLRKRAGGIHANTHMGCYVGSILVYIVVSMGIEPLVYEHIYEIFTVTTLSAAVILIFSPVNHPNLMLNKDEKESLKKSTCMVLILEMLAIGCLYVIKINKHCVAYACLAIVTCAVLILLAKLFRQEV